MKPPFLPECKDADCRRLRRHMEQRISSQRARLRDVEGMYSQLRTGNNTLVMDQLRAEKAAHNHTRRCAEAHYVARNRMQEAIVIALRVMPDGPEKEALANAITAARKPDPA